MALAQGQMIATRYKVVRILGQGGYGAVYLVEDMRLSGRMIALKETFDNSPEAQQQFQIEATILARLSHASLPRVSDFFVEANGHQFLVMDYVEGEDLADIIRRRAVPEQQALTWMAEICEAVAFLHSQNPPIIHRDIKPHNIKIRNDGHAILVDFGIAKLYNPKKQTAAIAKAVSSGFSPPEQYNGSTDPRSDVYALGATLFCVVTACAPPEAMDILMGKEQLIPARQLNPGLSTTTEQIIQQAMSLNSLRRYPTARELGQALQACLQGQSIPVTAYAPAAAVGAAVRCPTCGWMNRPTAKFCQRDRTLLNGGSPVVSSAPAMPSVTPQMLFEMGNAQVRKRNHQQAVAAYVQAAQGGFEDRMMGMMSRWTMSDFAA